MKNKLACFFCMLLVLGFSSITLADASTNTAILSVRGEAVLMVEPDQVSITIGVISDNKNAKLALAENSQTMRDTIAALESLGFIKDDYQTQNFSIRPQWSSRPSNSSNAKREIIGYSVNNSLQLKTGRIDDIGDVIAATTDVGANQIQSIQFGLKNPRQYREQAIVAASNNAKADAQSLAKANGVRIINVQSINLNNASASISQVPKAMVMESRMMADSAPPIQAGDISVRASVNIVYEIDSAL